MKKNNKDIILELKEIYGDKYDYSKINYIGSKEKLCLICPKHGDFWQRYDHLKEGCGCPFCRKENKINENWEYFVTKAREIHNNKYIYCKDDFVDSNSKIKITCPEHGEFYQTMNNHVNSKQGCPKCYHESRIGKYKMTTEEFIKKAKETHGDKYDYSQTKYNGLKNKLKIICPIHGEFWQIAYDHLRGFGCEKCKYLKNTDTTEEFIKKAKEIHGDKYDYSKIEYVNNHTKVCIICPEHGEFWMKPSHHLLYMGCPKCNMYRLEKEVENILEKYNVDFIWQANSKTLKWLGKQSLDFYLPEYNTAIECQGEQHFQPSDYFGGEEKFKKQIENDLKKENLCKDNKIKLIYYTHVKNTLYHCCMTEEELIKEIMGS